MMLEGKSCLVSRSLPSSCEPESEWEYLAHEVLSGKRPAPEDFEMDEVDGGSGKRSKSPSPQPHTPDISESHGGSSRHASSGGAEQHGAGRNLIGEVGRDLSINLKRSIGFLIAATRLATTQRFFLFGSILADQEEAKQIIREQGREGMMLEGKSCLVSRSLPSSCEPESEWEYLAHEVLSGKRPAPEDFEMDEVDGGSGKRSKSPSSQPHTPDISESHGGSSRHASSGGAEQHGAGRNLIGEIGRDLSINCLLKLSRSDYGTVASLNRDFNSLVRSGEIYRLRRQNKVAEHWVYFSCNVLEWDAYDPYRGLWIQVPKMPPDECFRCSDKESLAVGTELLVFGMAHIVFRYSILTNSWTRADPMNSPRCLFGSTSVSGKAYVTGGTDSSGRILSSAEMYDSETHTWTPLPSMNRARKMCSGVFMDGKFYVLGGVTNNNKVLTCGEEYDLKQRSWRIIENMFEGLNAVTGAPPLIAVVNNQLYAADYSENDVKKYDKQTNKWITLGKLPERSESMNGWGLAFRACGDRLIVIGGPRTPMGGTIELNSWIPDEQPPVWNLIVKRPSGNFVYNCAVMGC